MSADTFQSAQSELEKKVKTVTQEYVEGIASVLPNSDFRAKRVYTFDGVGKIFSGNYYAKKVRHIIDINGYNVELTVMKTEHNNTSASSSTRPAPTTTPAPVSQSNGQHTMYTIQRGDTLTSIARRYRTTVAYLASINNITNVNLIIAGRPLKVPVSNTGASPTTTTTTTQKTTPTSVLVNTVTGRTTRK